MKTYILLHEGFVSITPHLAEPKLLKKNPKLPTAKKKTTFKQITAAIVGLWLQQ